MLRVVIKTIKMKMIKKNLEILSFCSIGKLIGRYEKI